MKPHTSFRISAFAAATALVIASPTFAQQRINIASLQSEPTHDRFIVKYREGSEVAASAAAMGRALSSASNALPRRNGRRLGLAPMRRMATGASLVRTDRALDRAEAESLMRQLASDPNVEYVEVDQKMYPVSTPNDSYYGDQWHYYESTGGARVNQAWDTTTGTGVVVAVLDTGITNHSDLNGNVLPGYDMIADAWTANDGGGRDSNPSDPGDWYTNSACGSNAPPSANSSWHGTHVAGTIAAVTNNSKGVAGVAHGARIVPVRVLGRCGGYVSDIAEGIVWASGGSVSGVPTNQNPAEVINMSLGGPGSCSSTYQSAINSAVGRGTAVVVAAGNNSADTSGYQPASCSNVINVASTDRQGTRSSFSNYGSRIDLAAPGSNILSTYNTGSTSPGSESYSLMSGTSMAAPHVAGIVALMQAVGSHTPAQVEQMLKDTARALPGNCSGGCGAGIVDAQAAVLAAGGGDGNQPPAADFSSSVSGMTVSFTDTSTDSDGSIVSRSWDFGDGTTSTEANPQKTYGAEGTYSVKLTVTDDEGASNTRVRNVTVGDGGGDGGGDGELENGIPVGGLSGGAGAMLRYTLEVPAGAGNLRFVTSGGSGDPDLYVKFGAAPTTGSYDCRSETPTTSEGCTINTVRAGTYHVLVYGYSAFNGVSLAGSYNTDGGGVQTYANPGNYQIHDRWTVDSPITVSGRTGNAPDNAAVALQIVHSYRGDLRIDLVAPDGSAYRLKNTNYYDSTDNVNATYTVNLSSEALNGTWRLRVTDVEWNDTGYIDAWSLTF